MSGLGRRTHYRKHLTDSVLYDLPEPKEDERIAKVVATRGGNQFEIVLAGSAGGGSSGSKIDDGDDDGGSAGRTCNEPGLAILPTKFHKLVWVKRNDYVIVRTGIDAAKPGEVDDDGAKRDDDDDDDSGKERKSAETGSNGDPGKTGIRFIINHILYKDQVKHLVSSGLWPTHDPEFPVAGTSTAEPGDQAGGGDDNDVDDVGNSDGGAETTTDDDNHHQHHDDGIVYTEYDMDNDDDLFVNTNRLARLEIQDSDSDESSDDDDDD